jgi:type IV secretion system protein VirD4
VQTAAQVFLLCLAPVSVAFAATAQYLAASLGYQRQLGPPALVVDDLRIYPSWAALIWAYRFWKYVPALFSRAETLLYICGGGAIVVSVGPVLLHRGAKCRDAHGSARPRRHHRHRARL